MSAVTALTDCNIRIHTMDVVVIAAIVPIGIDFWASRKSPDRLEPAMIPARKRQLVFAKSTNHVKVTYCSPNIHNRDYKNNKNNQLKACGIIPTMKTTQVLTCDRGEVYSHQQSEETCDVCQDVAVGGGCWTVWVFYRRKPTFLQHCTLFQVFTE